VPATAADTRILDAAETLFARQGFAATTIKAIGAEAGLNPALLYYYFPDKARLYHAVLERRIGAFSRRALADLPATLPPLEAIARLLHGYGGMMRQAPDFPRLLARELADHEAEHALPLIREIATGVFQRLCDLIRAGQRQGEIRPDLEPRFAAVSTIAQLAWFYVAQPAVARLLGHEATVPAREQDRFTEHAVGYALAALTPSPGRRPARSKKRVRR
jgi:AcrR family transcriptional regulator